MYQKDPAKEQRPRECMKNDISRDGDSKRCSGCLREAETGDFDFAMIALAPKARNLLRRITSWGKWDKGKPP